MISILAKVVQVDGVDIFVPQEDIPANHKTRFQAGAYDCIPASENWPDDPPPAEES